MARGQIFVISDEERREKIVKVDKDGGKVCCFLVLHAKLNGDESLRIATIALYLYAKICYFDAEYLTQNTKHLIWKIVEV